MLADRRYEWASRQICHPSELGTTQSAVMLGALTRADIRRSLTRVGSLGAHMR